MSKNSLAPVVLARLLSSPPNVKEQVVRHAIRDLSGSQGAAVGAWKHGCGQRAEGARWSAQGTGGEREAAVSPSAASRAMTSCLVCSQPQLS